MMNSPAATTATAVEKRCCVCGKDVSGQRRFKDEKGYWCEACNREDARKQGKVLKVRCPECHKSVAENLMVEWHDRRICSGCKFELSTKESKDTARLILAGKQRTERNKIKMQVAIAASVVLGLFLMYQFGVFGGGEEPAENENQTRTLLEGARAAGIVFLVMLVGFIFWIKRQI
jgi:hypothetical protein